MKENNTNQTKEIQEKLLYLMILLSSMIVLIGMWYFLVDDIPKLGKEEKSLIDYCKILLFATGHCTILAIGATCIRWLSIIRSSLSYKRKELTTIFRETLIYVLIASIGVGWAAESVRFGLMAVLAAGCMLILLVVWHEHPKEYTTAPHQDQE